MAPRRLGKLCFFAGIYGALPSALIAVVMVAWMMAVENATLVLLSADSPDGRYRAEVVREDPGVSSGYEYMVRLMPAGLTPVAKSLHVLPFGPVYVALDAHHEPDKLLVEWTGRKEVTIHCKGCAGAQQGRGNWQDLSLKYETD